MTREKFKSVVADALARIPLRFRTAMKNLSIVVEDRAWAKDALTAHEVTTMQAFRDLFADAVLRPGDQVEIRRGCPQLDSLLQRVRSD